MRENKLIYMEPAIEIIEFILSDVITSSYDEYDPSIEGDDRTEVGF